MTLFRHPHLRVGAAAVAAFVVLLLLGAARGEGRLDPGVPASAPETTVPSDPGGGFDRRDGLPRQRGDGGFGGGDGPGPGPGGGVPGGGDVPGGTAPAPAPDTSGGGTT